MKPIRLRSLIFAALFSPFLFVCALAQTPSPSPEVWTSVRSKNFFLFGDASETDIRQAANRLEQFREAFRQLFPQIKVESPIPTNVVVFKNEVSYRPFKPRRPDGTVDDGIAGFFQPGDDANYITLALGDKRADPYSTIFHEYVHFVFDTKFGAGRMPVWLNEGLAEYYETLHVIDGHRVSVGGPRAEHLRALRQSELIPPAKFFAAETASLQHAGDSSRNLFYAQAWALVHYLLGGDLAAGHERIGSFLNALEKKEPAETAFRAAFGADYAAAEKALRAQIAQTYPAAASFSLTKPISVEASTSSAVLNEAEANAWLGDLLLHSNRLAEAEIRLKRSLSLSPDLAIANTSLGLLYSRQEKLADAKRHLEKALAANRSNHFAFFNYAYALSWESVDPEGSVSRFPAEASRRMRDALRQAIALNPRFAESYRLLAFVNMVNGEQLDEALSSIKRAIELEPENREYSLLLGQILLLQERYGEAKEVAAKLNTAQSDEAVRSDARNILQTVNIYLDRRGEKDADGHVMRQLGVTPPLIVKRSTLTEAQISEIEFERSNMNLNRILKRPEDGEKQIVGYLEKAVCVEDGIEYTVRVGSEVLRLSGRDFRELRLAVLTEGERSFEIGCGIGFDKQLTVLTYRPAPDPRSSVKGRLVAITFVPETFQLRTPEEMARFRHTVIEDDRLYQKSNSKRTNP